MEIKQVLWTDKKIPLIFGIISIVIGFGFALLIRMHHGFPHLEWISPRMYFPMVAEHGSVLILLLVWVFPIAFFANLYATKKDAIFMKIAHGITFLAISLLGYFFFNYTFATWEFFPGDMATLRSKGILVAWSSISLFYLAVILYCFRFIPRLKQSDKNFIETGLGLSAILNILTLFPILGLLVFAKEIGSFSTLYHFLARPSPYTLVLLSTDIFSEVVRFLTPHFNSRLMRYSRIAIYGTMFLGVLRIFIFWLDILEPSKHSLFSNWSSFVMVLLSVPLGALLLSMIEVILDFILFHPQLYRKSILKSYILMSFFCFIVGITTGIIIYFKLGVSPLPLSYFLTAHFHTILFAGPILSTICGIIFYLEQIRHPFSNYPASHTFVGFIFSFFPMFMMGINGIPRYSYLVVDSQQIWEILSFFGCLIFLIGITWQILDFLPKGSAQKFRQVILRRAPPKNQQ